jgi:hypothetical protein
MKLLATLRAQLVAGEFEFTQHALKRVVERNIANAEIREADAHAVIIEDYPSDKYGPSCLLLGMTITTARCTSRSPGRQARKRKSSLCMNPIR